MVRVAPSPAQKIITKCRLGVRLVQSMLPITAQPVRAHSRVLLHYVRKQPHPHTGAGQGRGDVQEPRHRDVP